MRKPCLALQCIRMIICKTAFLIKVSLFSKMFDWIPAEMSFQETFDINYDYYDYYCKSANIIFLLYLKCYQSFKNYLTGKLNKTCLVNICFAYSSRTVFWDLGFCFCLKVHNLDGTFTLIRKKILCHIYFICSCAMFCRLDPLAWITNLLAGSMVFR